MIEVLSVREHWCAPDERIMWCLPTKPVGGKARYVLYQVSGLDEAGNKKFTSGKLIGGVASGAAGFALEAAAPSTGDNASTPSLQKTVVSGGRNCLAASYLSAWQATGANKSSLTSWEFSDLTWVLTSHRLGLLQFGKVDDGRSLTAELKGRLTGGSREETAPKAVQLPGLTVHAEIPREAIARVEKAGYKIRKQSRDFLRVRLSDDSTIDLTMGPPLLRGTEDTLLEMTHGRK
ncbi:hypothetical protein [Saccharopolyspora mangrovi]|uniref:Uncharacterized protein n=1 Tax=Saccharopolyspora mangrovi TaxID=3082379 RepID=A0ABU6A7U7_9PSEU|nr:hypothetical protein [Saccharopolyspora sp. S2-29]MEB3367564.1 hypothetical protein [Saccharopolyspora sp. S2-29]